MCITLCQECLSYFLILLCFFLFVSQKINQEVSRYSGPKSEHQQLAELEANLLDKKKIASSGEIEAIDTALAQVKQAQLKLNPQSLAVAVRFPKISHGFTFKTLGDNSSHFRANRDALFTLIEKSSG